MQFLNFNGDWLHVISSVIGRGEKRNHSCRTFLSFPNHTANDMQLIPIEKLFSNRDSIGKAKEAFLISKGRTLVPHGLNIREETY